MEKKLITYLLNNGVQFIVTNKQFITYLVLHLFGKNYYVGQKTQVKLNYQMMIQQ